MGCVESRFTESGSLTCPFMQSSEDRGTMILERYLVSFQDAHRMGSGSSSVCYKALDTETDTYVAVKLYKAQLQRGEGRPDHVTLKKFRRQIAVMQELQQPFATPEDPSLWCDDLVDLKPSDIFMKLLDFSKDERGRPGPDPTDGMLYIVTELAQYSLKAFIGLQRTEGNGELLPKSSVQRLAKQIVLVVAGLHAKGFVHLDLKPENLMKFPDGVKLIDVDGCVRAGSKVSINDSSVSYSPCYCAPDWAQFLVDEGASGIKAAPALDAWSVGVTICDLVGLETTLHPALRKFAKYSNSQDQTMYRYMRWLASMKNFPLPELIEDFDVELSEFLMEWLLVTDAPRRRTLAECLSAPYFADACEVVHLPSKLVQSSLQAANRKSIDAKNNQAQTLPTLLNTEASAMNIADLKDCRPYACES